MNEPAKEIPAIRYMKAVDRLTEVRRQGGDDNQAKIEEAEAWAAMQGAIADAYIPEEE